MSAAVRQIEEMLGIPTLKWMKEGKGYWARYQSKKIYHIYVYRETYKSPTRVIESPTVWYWNIVHISRGGRKHEPEHSHVGYSKAWKARAAVTKFVREKGY